MIYEEVYKLYSELGGEFNRTEKEHLGGKISIIRTQFYLKLSMEF